MILVQAAAGLTADYGIVQNGTAYSARIGLVGAAEYSFWEPGLMGEKIPVVPQDVRLSDMKGGCDPCNFSWDGRSVIRFPQGNYTLSYTQAIRDNHFIVIFDEPADVTLSLPAGLDVRNPLLGSISSGGTLAQREDGTLLLTWNRTRFAECRFYEPFREFLLVTFFTIWTVLAIVLVLPFLLPGRRGGS